MKRELEIKITAQPNGKFTYYLVAPDEGMGKGKPEAAKNIMPRIIKAIAKFLEFEVEF